MEIMKQNDLLYSIRIICLALLISFVILSCKKRIKEVEINVVNVQTFKGIEGVEVYHNDIEYKSDENGKIFLPKKWDYREEEVYTNFGLTKYFSPNFYENCTVNNKHVIESELLQIPVEVSRVLKLKLVLENDTNARLGCFILDDLPDCSGEFHQSFERFKNYLNIPGKVGWDIRKDYLTYFMVQSPEPVAIKVYYGCEEGWDIGSVEPDMSEEISLDRNSDTTYYTLILK